MSNSIDLVRQAAKIAAEKKATRIMIMDLKEKSDICRYKMICSGSNDKQTKAIAQAIEEHCKKNLSTRPIAVEGLQSGHWILMDYGDTMVHIFFDYVRDYYAIEGLWADAARIDPLPMDQASAPQ